MPAVSTIIAVAGLAVGLAGTGYSVIQQQKAAKEQKKAAREQRNQEEMRVRRQRRQAIREAQLKRATVVNFAESMGIGGSSAPAGASGSLESQLGSAIGFSEAVSNSNAKIGMFNQRALDANTRGVIGGAIGNLGFKAASMGMSMGAFQGGGGGSSSLSLTGPSSNSFLGFNQTPRMNSWQASFG